MGREEDRRLGGIEGRGGEDEMMEGKRREGMRKRSGRGGDRLGKERNRSEEEKSIV